ncbi:MULTISPECIES: hypothetical protein [unclassified Maridesulfovibrio]|uniref:hypothetical protein n=1 Tax=unclassified Maridesulfovibrio TaxID=2794999 RepID=UPI003B412884
MNKRKILKDINELKEFCKQSSKPVVGLFHQTYRLEDIFSSIASRIDKKKLTPIFLVTCDVASKTEFLQTEEFADIPAYISNTIDFSSIHDIAVAIVSDKVEAKFSHKSKVISIPHVFLPFLHDISPYTALNRLRALIDQLPHCDAFFLGQAELDNISPEALSEIISSRYPAAGYRRNGKLTIIKGGYLKADLARETIQNFNLTRDAVLISPASFLYQYRYRGKVVSENEKLSRWIDMLTIALRSLPNVPIIFRTYPGEADNGKILEFIKAFSNEKNVYFDTKNSTLNSFARARVYVTDISYGRLSFSLATDLPHIAYKSPNKSSVLGFVANDKEQYAKTLQQCYHHSALLQKKTIQLRSSVLYNCGSSYQYLLDSIEAFVNDEKRDYWLAIDKNYVQGDWKDPAVWKKWWEEGQKIPNNIYPIHLRKYLADNFSQNLPVPLPLD